MIEISDLSGKFTLNSEVYKVETNTLLSLPNREYKKIMKQHLHLRGINMITTMKNLMNLYTCFFKSARDTEDRIISRSSCWSYTIWMSSMSPGNETNLNNLTLSRAYYYYYSYSSKEIGFQKLSHKCIEINRLFTQDLLDLVFALTQSPFVFNTIL